MGQINLGAMLIQQGLGENHAKTATQNRAREDKGFDKQLSTARKNTLSTTSNRKSLENSSGSTTKEVASSKAPSQEVKPQSKLESVGTDKTPVASDEMTPVPKESTDEIDVEAQMMLLLSEALQIPVEQLQELLSEMSMTVQDLLIPEHFGEFLENALGSHAMLDLLTGDQSQISELSQIFEKITTLQNTFQESFKYTVESSRYIEGPYEDALLGTNYLAMEEIGEVGTTQTTAEVAMQTTSAMPVQVQEEETDTETTASFLQGDEASTEVVGDQVPVHHFTSTSFVLQQYYKETSTNANQTFASAMGFDEVLLDQIDFKAIGELKELTVQLSPKELGQLTIKVLEQNGNLMAEIKVDNEKAKLFILNEIDVLKESLKEEGLNVSEVKVDIGQDQRQSHMEQERQKSQKRIQELVNKHFVEETEEDENPLTYNDSEVDYMV